MFLAFVLCGGAGRAGRLHVPGPFGNITVVAGLGMELQSIAAAVVGGVNIIGGIGSACRRAAGRDPDRPAGAEPAPNGRRSANSGAYALLGLLILLAVAIDTVVMNRLRTIWARNELQMDGSDQLAEQETPAHVA